MPRRVAISALLFTFLVYLGARPVGSAPPIGPLLDPLRGVWSIARDAELPRNAEARISSLGADVTIVYDDRAVPHIFAATIDDAIRALGYVVARDRLFQMELQARAASGRLTELGGRRLLGADREMRRVGLPWAAERKRTAIDTAGPGWRSMVVYAEGVRARVAELTDRDVPLEYHLLGVRPGRWEPEMSLHMLNRMGWTLTYRTEELRYEQVRSLVGDSAAAALFPARSPIQEPIQPNGQRAPRFDFSPLPPPSRAADGERSFRLAARLREALPDEPFRNGDEALGSNNWAVAPRRTAAGRALLAGDPHLELTLPSIWYEAHLVVPGVLDSYGVTIPGLPGIIIGFNRDVAWTFTNTEADVLDYYAEAVDDTRRPTRYRVDGEWRPVQHRVETYRGPGGKVIATDTLLLTHRGPLINEGGLWLSLRWTLHDPSDESAALARAARATTATGWLDSAATSFFAPAQNMLTADRAGTIAIRSTGHYPVRARRGFAIVDGRSSSADWQGVLPVTRYPQAVNPPQGYLASANQQPVDPRVDSTYLGADWYAPWRAIRINELLRADSQVTPDAMRRYQTDPRTPSADLFVPAFLVAAEAMRRAGRSDSTLAAASRLLAEWDRRYTKDNERAVLFEMVMGQLADRTWDELVPPSAWLPRMTDSMRTPARSRVDTPSAAVLLQLLRQPASEWWDVQVTERVVERRDDILAASLRDGYREAIARHGNPAEGGWRWDRVRHANIDHLMRLPSLSALAVPVQGGRSTLNPSSGDGRHGASWRMVVEMGAEPRAWTIYPGGQSGNAVSARYRDRVAKWANGELDEVLVPRSAAVIPSGRVSARLVLHPASER